MTTRDALAAAVGAIVATLVVAGAALGFGSDLWVVAAALLVGAVVAGCAVAALRAYEADHWRACYADANQRAERKEFEAFEARFERDQALERLRKKSA